MASHNGLGWMDKEFRMDIAIPLFTDASDTAMAAVMGTKWTVIEFNGRYKWLAKKSIGYRELAAVVLCLATFSKDLKNKYVIMNIDNQGIQQALEKGTSTKEDIMGLIRAAYFYTGINNVTYKTVHIGTHINSTADALSRQNYTLFRLVSPGSDPAMTPPRDFLIDF